MILKVNGNNVDIVLENEKTVGEVLKAFEEEISKNNATTISITLDGKKITAKEFDNIIKTPITESTCLELSIISKDEIADSFKVSQKQFNALVEQLTTVPVLLQSGKNKDANIIITNLATEIDRFCHIAALSALFPDTYSKFKIDNKEVGTFFSEFAPILSDFEKALENNDSVTIGDLAEYEIGPRLESISNAINLVI